MQLPQSHLVLQQTGFVQTGGVFAFTLATERQRGIEGIIGTQSLCEQLCSVAAATSKLEAALRSIPSPVSDDAVLAVQDMCQRLEQLVSAVDGLQLPHLVRVARGLVATSSTDTAVAARTGGGHGVLDAPAEAGMPVPDMVALTVLSPHAMSMLHSVQPRLRPVTRLGLDSNPYDGATMPLYNLGNAYTQFAAALERGGGRGSAAKKEATHARRLAASCYAKVPSKQLVAATSGASGCFACV